MKAMDILTLYETLSYLSDKELDLNTACSIAENIRSISVQKQVVEQKRNLLTQELLQKYGEKDSDGNLVEEDGQVKITDIQAFNEEMLKFLNTEVDTAPDLVKIKKSDLKSILISPQYALGLLHILKEER